MLGLRGILHAVWVHLPPISFRAMLAALAVLAIDTFDSFGLDQQADEQAARTIGMFEGPFYGMFDGRRGQQAVTVVLIDDASLRNQDWTVPLAYGSQAQLVGAIAYYDPAAIFLDFSYSWPHGADPAAEVSEFADTLAAESQGGRIRVMIGQIGAQTPEDAPVFEPLRRLQSVGVDWNSRTWINYPFRAAAMPSPFQADGARPLAPPMAAVALYEAYCARQRELGNQGACKPGWLPPIDGELAMTWGFGASKAMRPFVAGDDQACLMPDQKLSTRVRRVVEQAAGGLFRAAYYDADRARDAAETRCVYSDTVTAAQLLNPAQQDETALAALIKNRVVLVGAAHSFTDDMHIIPHVGRVPGVFIHAMAVDNLITDQDRYTRPPPPLIYDLDWADAIEILLTLALIGVMWQAHLVAMKHEDKGERRRILWTGAAVGVGVIIVTLGAERAVLHWPPLNVFGVAVLAFSVFALLEQHSEKLAAGKKPS
jgi:CHASE2 domain-containing sensor protein